MKIHVGVRRTSLMERRIFTVSQRVTDLVFCPDPRIYPSIIAELAKTVTDLWTNISYVLDHVAVSDVYVYHEDDAGVLRRAKFTQHPEWSKWAGEMSAGEFWAAVGNEWVKDCGEVV